MLDTALVRSWDGPDMVAASVVEKDVENGNGGPAALPGGLLRAPDSTGPGVAGGVLVTLAGRLSQGEGWESEAAGMNYNLCILSVQEDKRNPRGPSGQRHFHRPARRPLSPWSAAGQKRPCGAWRPAG